MDGLDGATWGDGKVVVERGKKKTSGVASPIDKRMQDGASCFTCRVTRRLSALSTGQHSGYRYWWEAQAVQIDKY
jgi:hypothetical protein